MFYNPVDKSFTLNTTERFPTEVWITRLRFFSSGATTPIDYDITTYNYRILTDNGLTVKLDTDGANLINNPATNYFSATEYTPVRVAGSNLFYFGARYYDHELGVWSVMDPMEQDWNVFAYCGGDPLNYVDLHGLSWKSFWRGLGIASLDFLSGGLISGSILATGALASTTAIGAVGIGIGAAASVGGLVIDPALMQTAGGVNNVIHNWEGINTGEGKAFGKFMVSFLGGTVSGTADWGNLATFGAFHDLAAIQSAAGIGYSHNYAYDKRWYDSEAYDVSYEVLSDMYSYGVRGTWTKITGDLVYSGHVLGEPAMVPYSDGSMYNETKNRFHYMNMKMNMKGHYDSISEGGNDPTDELAHRIGGKILGGKVYYYGFEVWGENYVRWEQDDFIVDGNKGINDPYRYWH